MTLRPSWSWRIVAMAAVAVILFTTLRANPAQVDRVAETAWRCLVCGEAGVTDVLLNLILFAPLGLALGCLGWRWQRALPMMLLLTIAIESSQALFLAGRDASLSDVLANSLGGGLGFALATTRSLAAAPTATLARRMAAVLVLLSSTTWLATGWGLRVAGDAPTPWVGQRLRQWRGHDAFAGTMGEATLNGIVLPNDPVDPTPMLRDSTTLRLALTRNDTTIPLRPVSLLRIVDRRGRTVLGVDQRGDALHVGIRMRASRFLVRTPVWSFEHAVRRMPVGTTWRGEWRWLPDRVELRYDTGDGTTEVAESRPLSVALGWVFVHPFAAVVGPLAPWWTALWLLLWGAPLGWCLAWVRGPERLAWALVACCSLVGASWATAIPVRGTEVAQWIGALALGYCAARWRR